MSSKWPWGKIFVIINPITAIDKYSPLTIKISHDHISHRRTVMLKQFQESIHSRLVRFAAAVSQSVSQSLSQSVTPLAEWRFLLLLASTSFYIIDNQGTPCHKSKGSFVKLHGYTTYIIQNIPNYKIFGMISIIEYSNLTMTRTNTNKWTVQK